MRLAIFLLAPALALLSLADLSFEPEREARAQTTTTIHVGDLWFCDPAGPQPCGQPHETAINVGDTIEWQWVGVFPHTTTECAGDLDACPGPHSWDSPAQKSGTFAFTFDSPGTYVYRCQLHQFNMRGRITVLAPTPTPMPTPSPTPSPASSPAAALPAPTPTPTAAAVPAGGGVPPEGTGPAGFWWLALAAAGGLLLIAGAAVAAGKPPR